MRVGVFLPNWIGDVVMATPAIRTLRQQLGSAGRLIGIMRPYVADVLAGSNWFNDEIYYDRRPSIHPGFADRATYGRLRAAQFDLVVLLTNSLRTAWMAWRSGARQRVGYAGDSRGWLLTTRLPRPPAKRSGEVIPTIDGYLRVVQAAGFPIESRALELATTPADELAADAVWNQLGLPSGDRVVMLNSGGAYGAAKHWPAHHFADLARRIVQDGDYTVLVNCGPAERPIARTIVALADNPRVVGLAEWEQLPVGLTKACVKRSRMVVSTDSGPRFFAIAFGKPVVTIFGPTNPAATFTHYDLESSLSLGLDCQPCMARMCPLRHHRCMTELTAEHVHSAVYKALRATKLRGVA